MFGVLNVTPDSFSDGGLYTTPDDAIAAGCRMADEGADAVDVGGESTRPGSKPVPTDQQIRRIETVIIELAKRFGKEGPAISIDTRSARVAEAALNAGALIVNDVSALRDDPAMAGLIADRNAGVILMHMKGTPADMQDHPTYNNMVNEIKDFLAKRTAYATQAGIATQRVIIDPGIGFGKTTTHNLQILQRLDDFRQMGVPIMVGPSRKRFIGEILGIDRPTERLMGTAAVVSICVMAGVECIRVHDVAACRQVADMCAAISQGVKS
ncbi:MAG: dihydropteroate synthase [Planctomycetota bacterium]|nr:MAG: dihydropteroate synthase [Planctomycetota bacterium]